MSRYIDADTFEEVLLDEDRCPDVQDAIFELGKFPTADVKPVVHGNWIKIAETDEIVCEACNYSAVFKSSFCPNCGADMREVEE